MASLGVEKVVVAKCGGAGGRGDAKHNMVFSLELLGGGVILMESPNPALL
jgi:hypothetical protein